MTKDTQNTVKILMVCTGNICRSPTAQGFLEHALSHHGLNNHITVDSAGTTSYHNGHAPDPRSIDTAKKHGVYIAKQRARPIASNDFDHFDIILAMDNGHLAQLKSIAPSRHHHKIRLYLNDGSEVPDPYYGGQSGFDRVVLLIQKTTDYWVKELKIMHDQKN